MEDFVIKTRKKKEYEQFTCRIEIELLDKIRNIVVDNNLPSVNEFINDCLRFSIDNLKIMEDTDENWIQHKWYFRYMPYYNHGLMPQFRYELPKELPKREPRRRKTKN